MTQAYSQGNEERLKKNHVKVMEAVTVSVESFNSHLQGRLEWTKSIPIYV